MKIKERSLSYYSFIAGGRIVECLLFQSVLTQDQIQTASFRFWALIALSISFDYD